ncbi:class F sortase [Actinoplanes sp. TFC3]|uniref:class F sortase n=1 Tax=Actinoplanes sp. TFC3 TaxID=1710355 RepID=UPI0008340EE7|nr:class F sortase [Actinoplanes sp. TFC3]
MSGLRGTSRRSPGRALLLLLLGALLTTSAGVAACRSKPAADFGAPAATASPVAPAPAPSTAGPVPIQHGRPAATAPDSPTRLAIPALKLTAAVDAVGIDEQTGDFAVPPSVDRVGWYKFGPGTSAAAGSIVIAGHVDSAEEGEGAFFRLGSLEAGDQVELTSTGGISRTFQVVARQRYRKTAIPLQKYFARDGDVRLTLITCGGPFDQRTRHYRDNVVVTATPMS